MSTNETEVIKYIRRVVTGNIESGQKVIAKLAEDVVQHPEHALSWGDSAFMAAGKVWVAKQILAMIDGSTDAPDVLLGKVKAVVAREVIRGGRFNGGSTSVCSNLMDRSKLAAWADLADSLELA